MRLKTLNENKLEHLRRFARQEAHLELLIKRGRTINFTYIHYCTVALLLLSNNGIFLHFTGLCNFKKSTLWRIVNSSAEQVC